MSPSRLTPLQASILYKMNPSREYSREDLRELTGQKVQTSTHLRPLQFLGFVEVSGTRRGKRLYGITVAGSAWLKEKHR